MLVSPQNFTATLRISAPPAPIAAFDELWRNPAIPFSATILTNGSVEIRRIGDSEASAREPVDAMLVTVQEIASQAAVDVAKRQAALLDFETRLLNDCGRGEQKSIADEHVGTQPEQRESGCCERFKTLLAVCCIWSLYPCPCHNHWTVVMETIRPQ